MEYKIQELDIQTLSGTLNVGLTAHGDEKSIEDMINKMMQEGNMKFNEGERILTTNFHQTIQVTLPRPHPHQGKIKEINIREGRSRIGNSFAKTPLVTESILYYNTINIKHSVIVQ